jgi:hypothetical protein
MTPCGTMGWWLCREKGPSARGGFRTEALPMRWITATTGPTAPEYLGFTYDAQEALNWALRGELPRKD